MKELSIEEKAKAYDEAYKRVAVRFGSNVANEIFHELTEYEDERIRKDIVEAVELHKDFTQVRKEHIYAWLEKQGEHAKFRESIQIGDEVTRNKDGVLVNLSQLKRIAKPAENKGKHNMGISEATKKKLEDNLNKALEKETPESCNEFLEKQSEQKPWSKEDEKMLEYAIDMIEWYSVIDKSKSRQVSDWLKSLKDKVQPKQEWSDEDEDNFNSAIYYIRREPYMEKTIEPIVDWLESLKDRAQSQNTWKPSDEHYELEEFAKIVRCNLTGISKAVQKLFEAKYLQLTGNKMYGGFKD